MGTPRRTSDCGISRYVLVNSEWSRQSLIAQGVPAEKLITAPLAYEPGGTQPPARSPHRGPLRVLWLGTVSLRKGIPYLLEAARLLEGSEVRFRIVGSVQVDRRIVEGAPSNVEFAGPCPRTDASREYQGADVFVFPTVSDGFGITQVEAMYHALPVIATQHCGDVVTPGLDGFTVPIRNSEAIAAAIRSLDVDRSLLLEMSNRARKKARTFTIGGVRDRLIAELCTREAARAHGIRQNDVPDERRLGSL